MGGARCGAPRRLELMVLDLGVPVKDSLEVLSDLRRSGQRLPVIILTARGDPDERRVAGLEAGADDYIGKPFHFEELLARVRVRLRRRQCRSTQHQLLVGEVALDLRRDGQARVAEVELGAGVREVAADVPGAPEPGSRATSSCWLTSGATTTTRGRTSSTPYVRYLRRKLGSNRFETVRGVGAAYRV